MKNNNYDFIKSYFDFYKDKFFEYDDSHCGTICAVKIYAVNFL